MTYLDSLVSYIFNTEDVQSTAMGQQLKQAASKKPKFNVNVKSKGADCNIDVKHICGYDSKKDLCWIDYRSWVILPKMLQRSIMSNLNPQTWRGIIFQYSLWVKFELDIIKNLNNDIVIVLTLDGNGKYRFHTIPLYKSYLDWMSSFKFDKLNKEVSKNAIKTYGRYNDTIHILDNKSNKVTELDLYTRKIDDQTL